MINISYLPVLILTAVIVIVLVSMYNTLVRRRILVKEGWSGIGTFLQQRNDVIPNLVETVKGYAVHESSTLQDVVKLRNIAVNAATPTEQMAANNNVNKALGQFFALAEQYPDLKANTNFLSLQAELSTLETKINQSRRYYNGTVRDYNQSVAVFPSNLIARMFGFTTEPFFEEDAEAKAVPKVSFK